MSKINARNIGLEYEEKICRLICENTGNPHHKNWDRHKNLVAKILDEVQKGLEYQERELSYDDYDT